MNDSKLAPASRPASAPNRIPAVVSAALLLAAWNPTGLCAAGLVLAGPGVVGPAVAAESTAPEHSAAVAEPNTSQDAKPIDAGAPDVSANSPPVSPSTTSPADPVPVAATPDTSPPTEVAPVTATPAASESTAETKPAATQASPPTGSAATATEETPAAAAPKAPVAQSTDAQTTGAQTNSAQTNSAQPNGAQTDGAQSTGPKPADAQTTEANPAESKPAESKPPENQPSDLKPTEAAAPAAAPPAAAPPAAAAAAEPATAAPAASSSSVPQTASEPASQPAAASAAVEKPPAAATPLATEAATPPPASDPALAAINRPCIGKPDAIGTSRILTVDTERFHRLGTLQYAGTLPLADHEVVLTFDDGPLPPYSNQALDTFASQCVRVTYFLVGSMARAYPSVVKRIVEEGHTIGTHSEHHPSPFSHLPIDRLRAEIDTGIADVAAAAGSPEALAPFFRIPGLDRSELIEHEVAERSLVLFSVDTDADDWHRNIRSSDIVALSIRRLEHLGRGILLLHDIHQKTVAALPALLKELKEHGFHIVHVVPSPADQIAMAKRTRLLASAMAEQAMVNDSIDDSGPAIWPAVAAAERSDDVALPAPDPAAFHPDDASLPVDGEPVRWPQEQVHMPSPRGAFRAEGDKALKTSNANTEEPPAPSSARSHRRSETSDEDSSRAHRRHAKGERHGRHHAEEEGKPGLFDSLRNFASQFSPSQPAH